MCSSVDCDSVYGCRFSLVYRAGQAVTALCCCLSRPSEVLAGLPDHSVLCLDLGMCVCVFLPLLFFLSRSNFSRHRRAGGHPQRSRSISQISLHSLIRSSSPRRLFSRLRSLGPRLLLSPSDTQRRTRCRSPRC